MNVLLKFKDNEEMDIEGVIDTVKMYVGDWDVVSAEGHDLAVVVLDVDNMTIDDAVTNLLDVFGDVGVVLNYENVLTLPVVVDFVCHDGKPSTNVRKIMAKYGCVSSPEMSMTTLQSMSYYGQLTKDDIYTIRNAFEDDDNISVITNHVSTTGEVQ